MKNDCIFLNYHVNWKQPFFIGGGGPEPVVPLPHQPGNEDPGLAHLKVEVLAGQPLELRMVIGVDADLAFPQLRPGRPAGGGHPAGPGLLLRHRGGWKAFPCGGRRVS